MRSNVRSCGLGVMVVLALATPFVACSEELGGSPSNPTPVADGGGQDAPAFVSGDELRVVVPASGRVHVSLGVGGAPPAIVQPADPATSREWDLAFEGYDVFTNSGPSGSGSGSAFGPLDTVVFLDDVAPAVPFLSPDVTGGAFIRWWFYGGAPDHALYSRYHVYGVRDGDKTYKVQVLSYYGVRSGAPTSALYKVRWAEVTAAGASPTQVLENLDGTAGGTAGGDDEPVECLDLGTGARAMLTPTAARGSSAWHLCFRRQDISVNGGVGGPRGVTAVDLDAAKMATDTLPSVVAMDEASELGRFDAVTMASMDGQPFRGDRVVSAFGTLWLDVAAGLRAPSRAAWLVVGADGERRYLLGFTGFEEPTDASPGTIVMRVKSVR